MITSKEIKIKKSDEFTSAYIEDELKKQGLDVLRWAAVDCDENYYIINAAVVED